MIGSSSGRPPSRAATPPVEPAIAGGAPTSRAPARGREARSASPRTDRVTDRQIRQDGYERAGPLSRRALFPDGRAKELALTEVLPASSFISLAATHRPEGRVVWVDFDLARARGFPVGAGNQMTPALHDALIRHLSYTVSSPERRDIEVRADRYYPDGSGRAFFLPTGECVKGGGVTPFADPTDLKHSSGRCPLREGVLEAVFGRVAANLFSRGGTRVLALIDLGEVTDRIDTGQQEPQVLVVRCGPHLRPAHLLEADPKGWPRIAPEAYEAVLGAAPSRDQRVALAGGHAASAAEQLRWRFLHGGLDESNMGLAGEMLDFGTATTLARTAPAYVLDPASFDDGARFRLERRERERVFEALFPLRSPFPVAYAEAKDTEFLRACGLSRSLSRRLRQEHPVLAREFRKHLMSLAKVHRGTPLDANTSAIADAGVFDVYNLLRWGARRHLEGRLTAEDIEALLDPRYGAPAARDDALVPERTGRDAQGTVEGGESDTSSDEPESSSGEEDDDRHLISDRGYSARPGDRRRGAFPPALRRGPGARPRDRASRRALPRRRGVRAHGGRPRRVREPPDRRPVPQHTPPAHRSGDRAARRRARGLAAPELDRRSGGGVDPGRRRDPRQRVSRRREGRGG